MVSWGDRIVDWLNTPISELFGRGGEVARLQNSLEEHWEELRRGRTAQGTAITGTVPMLATATDYIALTQEELRTVVRTGLPGPTWWMLNQGREDLGTGLADRQTQRRLRRASHLPEVCVVCDKTGDKRYCPMMVDCLPDGEQKTQLLRAKARHDSGDTRGQTFDGVDDYIGGFDHED